MLRVGLSGGIGSGKSTVSARLAGLGAVVLDADRIAREVLAPGTPGLAEVVDRFGSAVVTADGALDRPALGQVVFADPAARRDLEAITHPRIAERTAELMAAAPADAVVVHDVPLLVEKAMGAAYHLVVIVGAGEGERLRRLVSERGMDPVQARARIASQADDAARWAAADVWLDNTDSVEQLLAGVDELWRTRLVPFERNVREGVVVQQPAPAPANGPDPGRTGRGERLVARLRRVLGSEALAVEEVGSPSGPADALDLRVSVTDLADLDDPSVAARLAAAGFHPLPTDRPHSSGGTTRPPRLLGYADPALAVRVAVRATP